jgi:hypothetical protein
MDGLSAWFVLAAEYCNDITNQSTEIFNFFQIFFSTKYRLPDPGYYSTAERGRDHGQTSI